MNETIECWACVRPGVLIDATTVQHDEAGVLRQCELPPRDIAHPDRQRVHRSNRYPSPYRTAKIMGGVA